MANKQLEIFLLIFSIAWFTVWIFYGRHSFQNSL